MNHSAQSNNGTKVLMVSDIHANCRALKAVLDRFGGADQIWCLGDIAEFGPSPARCVDLLRECGARTVQGNHDRSFASDESLEKGWAAWDQHLRPEHREYLRTLPTSLTLELDGRSCFLAHGCPRDHLCRGILHDDKLETVREKLAGCDSDFIIAGHVHVPMLLEVGSQLVVNAGATGQPEDGDCRAQCIIYEHGGFRLERVEYDLDALADDYARSNVPDWLKRTVLSWQRVGIVDLRGQRHNPMSDDPTKRIRLVE